MKSCELICVRVSHPYCSSRLLDNGFFSSPPSTKSLSIAAVSFYWCCPSASSSRLDSVGTSLFQSPSQGVECRPRKYLPPLPLIAAQLRSVLHALAISLQHRVLFIIPSYLASHSAASHISTHHQYCLQGRSSLESLWNAIRQLYFAIFSKSKASSPNWSLPIKDTRPS